MSEAGLGPATELEVELSLRAEFRACTVSSLAHAKAGGRERTGHDLYCYQGSLVFT